MPASAIDKDVFNKGLEYVINNANEAVILSGEPSNYSDVSTKPSNGGLRLGKFNLGSGNRQIQNDGSGGREILVDEQGYIALESDTANHIALVDTDNDQLIVYTEYDDGNGNPISVTADLAYNAGPTTFTLSEFTAS